MRYGKCTLSKYERRIFCAQKKVGENCLKPKFIEQRCWYLKYSKDELKMVAKKGVNKIVAFSGFSDDAVEYAEKYRPKLRLFHKDTVIKQRRKVAVRAKGK